MTHPIEPSDILALTILHGASLSPDSGQVVYCASQLAEGGDEEHLHLWLLPLDGGKARALTTGPYRDSEPQWAPDGKRIAFLSNRGEKPQLYLIALDGGEPEALTALPQGVGSGPAWSPDGSHLAFSALPEARETDSSRPYRVTRHIPRFDGLGNPDEAAQAIFVVPATGGEARRLTGDALHHGNPTWSPDGKEIAFVASINDDSFRSHAHLRCVTLTGEERIVVSEWGYVEYGSSLAWTPDGARLLFIGQPFGRPAGFKNDLWAVAREGAPQCRSAKLAVGVGGYIQPDMPGQLMRSPRTLVAADGRSAIVQGTEGGSAILYRVALTGEESVEPLLTGERSCAGLGLVGNTLLFAQSTLNDPANLFLADVATGTERQLTDLNGALLAVRLLPTVERLSFPSADSTKVEGWLLKPATGKPPYPTVLYIHGGPHAGFGYMYEGDFQLLAGAGMAVLFINQRGSTGYGDTFASIVGEWGNLDYADTIAGVDYAIAQGWVDGERLGVAGLSAGGYLGAWIVGHTERFKAAMLENPVIDWVSFYGTSDIGPRFAAEELGGQPHEIPEVYRRCSPISSAHLCRTPTLLVQGEADHRCPPGQSEQFYRALKATGCPTEMLRLPGGSHLGTIRGTPRLRRAQNDALLAWMKRYLLGE